MHTKNNMILLLIPIIFYILCVIHFIYRNATGGKRSPGPGMYLNDDRCMKADTISCVTTIIGTIILLIIIF